jgi:hypothetical protein
MRTAVRTAEGWRVHLLAFADQLWREAALARLFGREARRGSVIEHQLAVVGGFEKGHGPSNT